MRTPHRPRLATLLIGSAIFAAPAAALNPPQVDQAVHSWTYVLDMNTPGDPSDDYSSGTFFDPEGVLRLDVADCGTLDQPQNQPKSPDACGSLAISPGGSGFWLYYDGDNADAPPGGWNQGNQWWRNRLILRYGNDNLTFLGRYRTNPAHPECLTSDPCPSGSIKFCGTIGAFIEGVQYSGGNFDFCSQPD